MGTSRGFSLIELMVVVAIVGIISAVAIPSYRDYVKEGRRSDAKSALMGLQQAMEGHRANNPYTTAISGSAPAAPLIFSSQVPVEGGEKTYDLTVHSVSATAYTLRATPTGKQAGDGYLELLSTGVRRWNKGGTTLQQCWEESC